MTDSSQTFSAIQTRYADHLFRSRLEARYAVFFDALGLRWAYEHEGYNLGELGWYLPDFVLLDWNLWVEVKGKMPTPEELAKCKRLAEGTHAAALFVGVPNSEQGFIWCVESDDGGGGSYESDAVYWATLDGAEPCLVATDDSRERVFFNDEGWNEEASYLFNLFSFPWNPINDHRIIDACRRANSARFEHVGGQK